MFVVFFFNQKTAYEMRISDWSSDVCSSDLQRAAVGAQRAGRRVGAGGDAVEQHRLGQRADDAFGIVGGNVEKADLFQMRIVQHVGEARNLGTGDVEGRQRCDPRSEERRVGKEWARPCRFRWSTIP